MADEAAQQPAVAQVNIEKPLPELDKLIAEKVNLAKKLGIMGNLEPIQGYSDTDEYRRIGEIDKRLWELVK
ncbi:hypothetical protein MJ749_13295 [Paenibacillus polymyxa]|uniref:hypothetical protein n=1 Tax=Paenibacillus polymyxa TaxID=1406 RepID=UPI001C9DD8A3|nr:hypothetical protein [Paenibacillus polymyxa]MBY7736281.1 hypothetical protein [Paenibacillus polymyxa]UMR33675.1 hypothetical protein MJ749_13295 [Paenibacillus polymyxa]